MITVCNDHCDHKGLYHNYINLLYEYISVAIIDLIYNSYKIVFKKKKGFNNVKTYRLAITSVQCK